MFWWSWLLVRQCDCIKRMRKSGVISKRWTQFAFSSRPSSVIRTACIGRFIVGLYASWYQRVGICWVALWLHIVVGEWPHVVVRNHVSTLSLYLGDRGMSGTLGILSSRKMPPRCRLMTLTYSKFTMYERWQRTMLVSVR